MCNYRNYQSTSSSQSQAFPQTPFLRLSSRQTLVNNGRIFKVSCHNMSRAHLPNLTLQLIHHDSPHPPLYNPLDTISDVLTAAYFRSIACSRLYSTKTDLKYGSISNGGEYFLSISSGTQPTAFKSSKNRRELAILIAESLQN
ncbi:hypothetical protein Bca4012_021021 [Brassica carinata]